MKAFRRVNKHCERPPYWPKRVTDWTLACLAEKSAGPAFSDFQNFFDSRMGSV